MQHRYGRIRFLSDLGGGIQARAALRLWRRKRPITRFRSEFWDICLKKSWGVVSGFHGNKLHRITGRDPIQRSAKPLCIKLEKLLLRCGIS
jgi:hypothetical protein